MRHFAKKKPTLPSGLSFSVAGVVEAGLSVVFVDSNWKLLHSGNPLGGGGTLENEAFKSKPRPKCTKCNNY